MEYTLPFSKVQFFVIMTIITFVSSVTYMLFYRNLDAPTTIITLLFTILAWLGILIPGFIGLVAVVTELYNLFEKVSEHIKFKE